MSLVKDKNNVNNKKDNDSCLFDFIISFIIVPLVCFPIFILLHKILPDLDWYFNLDRILLFIFVFGFLEFIFNVFKKFAISLFVIVIIIISIGTIREKYGFSDIYYGYRNMVFSLIDKPQEKIFNIKTIVPNSRKKEIIKALDFENDTVRNFSVQIAGKYFKEYKTKNYYYEYMTIIQSFSIFKEININWNYVHDPISREYFARASETINNFKEDPNGYFSGDCDDHAILMVACISSIGGRSRLVWTNGHIYPELFIGNRNDLEDITYLIRRELFKDEIAVVKDRTIYYHEEINGDIWLNLDYTEHFPGGKFMDEMVLDIYEP